MALAVALLAVFIVAIVGGAEIKGSGVCFLAGAQLLPSVMLLNKLLPAAQRWQPRWAVELLLPSDMMPQQG